MKVILRIALLTCLDGLEPIQSHQNVACDTALVSTMLQRTGFDLLCGPRAGANKLANIQHEYHARHGTHGSQFDHLKHNTTRRFDATRAGLVSIRGAQSERWMRSCDERWKLRSQVIFCIYISPARSVTLARGKRPTYAISRLSSSSVETAPPPKSLGAP